MVPFPEVIVRSATGLEDSPVDITDVDVIGIELSTIGSIRCTMFDYKTANKQSAINRALWAYGLKSLVNADAAYIIQVRPSPDSHKLTASSFSVYILRLVFEDLPPQCRPILSEMCLILITWTHGTNFLPCLNAALILPT